MSKDISIQNPYDAIENLMADSGAAVAMGTIIPVDYPKDVLFESSATSRIGNILSYRRLAMPHNIVLNWILLCDKLSQPTDMGFFYRANALREAIGEAHNAGKIFCGGPGEVFWPQIKGEKGVRISGVQSVGAGSPAFGVFLFTVHSKPNTDPRIEIRKLAPILEKAGVLTAAEAAGFVERLDDGPLRGLVANSPSPPPPNAKPEQK